MKGGKPHRRKFHRQQVKRSAVEGAEIEDLERCIAEQVPPHGTNPLSLSAASNAAAADAPGSTGAASGQGKQQQARDDKAGTGSQLNLLARRFDQLPISQYSKEGLEKAGFKQLTAIQRAALPHALAGRDVLGAAKTGSGKTLAFLLPVVESLYRAKWGHLDGLGALVISPTRELALQIFEELRKVGPRHELSAGLLIGGKDVKEEQARVAGMNILVATPGRLLQHMDETPGFDASQLRVLVLDEADRILDLGFAATLNAIVANLPREGRQTLLFSATQTKKVKDLARLSLKDPEYISVHAEAEAPTPLRLQQAYCECGLADKTDLLWSFIKTHLKCKVIIFLSTCKQVKFLFEAFRRLRPGVPLRGLHGRMSQPKRMAVFYEFCQAKAMVLFATDIAARGLDFPTVDWVLQADCPEDVASYIHRVGRTARYVSSGRGLLLLLPSEKEGMLKQLEAAKVPIKAIKHNPAKVQPVGPALQALLSKDAELKETAQRALVSYLRSVMLQPNRQVFDVAKLPAAEYAFSLGLPTAPKLRFLRRAGVGAKPARAGQQEGAEEQQQQQNGRHANGKQRRAAEEEEGSSSSEEEDESEEVGPGSEEECEEEAAAAEAAAGGSAQQANDSDDDLLVVKQRNVFNVEEQQQQQQQAAEGVPGAAGALDLPASGQQASKRKKLKIKAHAVSAARVVFDDEGRPVDPLAQLAADELGAAGEGEGLHSSMAERAAAARALLAARDREDRQQLRELRKQQRAEKRAKRLARERGAEAAAVATLGGAGGSGSEGEEYSSGSEREAGSDSQGEEAEERQEAGGRRGKRGRAAAAAPSDDEEEEGAGPLDIDLLDSSDDEGVTAAAAAAAAAARQRQQRGRKRAAGAVGEVAHLGMAPAAAPKAAGAAGREEESDEEDQRQREKKKVRRGIDASTLSLAEQEALALRMLAGGR